MVCHSSAITAKPVLARESSYSTMSAENYVNKFIYTVREIPWTIWKILKNQWEPQPLA
jgi:hypothetical protein